MNIIDIIICAILGLSLVSGMYKGFITSTLALFGFAGAWAGAYRTYAYLSGAVQANEGIMGILTSVLSGADMLGSKTTANTLVSAINEGNLATVLEGLNMPFIKSALESNILTRAFEGMGLSTLADYLTQTLLVSALNVFSFVVMFAVIYAAVLLLINLLSNVFRFPALRHMDWLLGGVFGLARGAVIVMLIFTILPAVTSMLGSMDIVLLDDMLAKSKLSGLFASSGFITAAIQSLMG